MRKAYNFWAYITTNPERTVLYTGMTNNISRRLIEHYKNRGKEDHFSHKYYCYCLVWCEWHKYVYNAINREKEIKRFSRKQKEELIAIENPEWRFLNKEICGV